MSFQHDIYTKGSMNDLVFRGRNKAYGAYELRTAYEERLKKSLLSFLFFLGSIAIASGVYQILKKPTELTSYYPTDPIVDTTKLIVFDKTPKDLEPLPTEKVEKNLYSNVEIVDKVKEDKTRPTDDIINDNGLISTTEETGKPPTQILEKITTSGGGGTGQPEIVNQPIDFPEVYPQFPGGDDALENYLLKNTRFPEVEEALGVTKATVLIGFVVNEDGSISNIEIQRKDRDGFNKMAFQVVKNMPRWIPGSQGGHPVKVNYSIPFTFNLED